MATKVNLQAVHQLLDEFKFGALFIEELGWLRPDERKSQQLAIESSSYQRTMIALLGGVGVYEVVANDGDIPNAKLRRKIYDEIVKTGRAEVLLIFVDQKRTKSLWYWVKRDAGGKLYPRDHPYFKEQTGDALISKLVPLFFDLSDYEVSEGKTDIPITKVAERLQQALDVQVVTKRFYEAYSNQRVEFTKLITGIDDDKDRALYASVMLNRLMFVYFLQKKGFVDRGDYDYLSHKLTASKARGSDRFYSEFLTTLFFKGFALPEEQRDAATNALLGAIRYLNGGLFLPHKLEQKYDGKISIPDIAFENVLRLFAAYSWNLNDTPGGADDELNPDVLGYIFEKYINQKDFGAYYTRPEITQYLGERTIHKYILDQMREATGKQFDSVGDLLMHPDARTWLALLDILDKMTVLDPACGSGAFLVAAMKVIFNIASVVYGRVLVEFKNHPNFRKRLEEAGRHESLHYFLKRQIIIQNLYGVDLMREATEIAKLRLFLTLVASARRVEELEPLPNVDFNIMPGNSLIGVREVPDSSLPLMSAIGKGDFAIVLREKNRLVDSYRFAARFTPNLQAMRDDVDQMRDSVRPVLDGLLLDEFQGLGIKYEQANAKGKADKRRLEVGDISRLEPFHWGFDFDRVLEHGGFDIIITNPPWDIFKPQAKEFFLQYSKLITKKKMTIKDFEEHQEQLLTDKEVADAWLEYLSRFPYISAYYRTAPQYKNQISVVNEKRTGSDVNLYKLFTEQCYNLLREGGECGIVLPSGIYTDLGAKQLREMLFGKTEVTGIFGFENSKAIFENVHRSFKFVVLTFKKGGSTVEFPAAFMRHEVKELDGFLKGVGGVKMSVELVRRLSPDSLSVMEFKSEADALIAQKMLQFPPLGEDVPGKWRLKLAREFDMTNDSHLFKTQAGEGRLPLYEGKMMHQFTHQLAPPCYWVDEAAGRKAVLGKRRTDTGQQMDYQAYRLGIRAVASNTNERSLISSVVPQNVFCGNSLLVSTNTADNKLNDHSMLLCMAVINSFALDWLMRMKVTTNINMFYIYQLPVPRYSNAADHPYFAAIVKKAAQLICTTSEFDALAAAVGLGDHTAGVTDAVERIKLRAELDAMVAHIYGLTETEFAHILNTFPIVAQSVKDATLAEYKRIAPGADDDAEIVAMIKAGEGLHTEFKRQASGDGSYKIARAVASMMNTYGGTVLVGVEDGTGRVVGVEGEYAAINSGNPERDGYTQSLNETIAARLQIGAAYSHLLDFTYPRVEGHDVCRITVQPSPSQLYMRDGSFLNRNASGSRVLSAQEAQQYIADHWRG